MKNNFKKAVFFGFLSLVILLILWRFYSFKPISISGDKTIDEIIVLKSRRELQLIENNSVLRTYKISLGSSPIGPKMRQGDGKTPEGKYHISGRNKSSKYHLSLRISYPNTDDILRAKRMGVNPGGDIMIHGLRNDFGWVGPFHRFFDWTQGCIAVTDSEIEEIYNLVANNTPVIIRP
jgi:murein L,D-transpeptidase YafK